jgi:ADP-ribose pyrophosphatase
MNNDSLSIPNVVASDRILDRDFIGVRIDHLARVDGVSYPRVVVEYGTSVSVVAIDDENRVLMVRQYRHPAGRWLLEIPAGGVDERDASPEAAALRELREETGFRGELTLLGSFFLACGYSDEYMDVFLAERLVADPLTGDEDEDVRLERVSLDGAMAMLDAGEIGDAKTVAALMLYQRHRERAAVS